MEKEWGKALRKIFDGNKVMRLATNGKEGMWIGSCYFTEDQGTLLIALEQGKNYHNLLSHPAVVFNIDRGVPDTFLQGEGKAEKVGEISEFPRERQLLFRKAFELVPFCRYFPGITIFRIHPTRLVIQDYSEEWKPKKVLEWSEELREKFVQDFPPSIPKWKIYFKATRPFAFTATVISALLGTLLAPVINWGYALLTLFTAIIVHAGVNVLSDYVDFKKGVDDYLTLGSSRVLVDGEMEEREHLRFGILLLALGAILGVVICALRGWELLWIGLAGYILGVFYTVSPFGWKYRALGDPAVFLAFGPLMALGAFFVQTSHFALQPALVSIPAGLLVIAILLGNNMRDIPVDRKVGYHTLASLLGPRLAGWYYNTLLFLAYFLVVLFVFFGWAPAWTLLALLTFPSAVKNMHIALNPIKVGYGFLDLLSAQLHFKFGVSFLAGLLISRFSLFS
ncbi:MAG: 1,4-dihydroxy-2-naphthoate octaprenyltransferase [bacterium JZ-2024 1]